MSHLCRGALHFPACVHFARPVQGPPLVTRVAPAACHAAATRCSAAPDDIGTFLQAADIVIQHGHLAGGVDPNVPAPVQSATHHTHTEVQCTLSGLDNAVCVVEEVEDDDEMTSLVSSSGSVWDSLDQAASTRLESGGLLAKALQTSLLLSPFFFWGTSMVAMKGVVPHTTPLMLGALRLLPAGCVLVAWAASTGRQQPEGWKAWAWVLAFALVDAAAFQGFLAEGLTRTSAGMGSVIIDSQPLSVAVLAALLFGEKLTPLGVLGLGLGVAGLGLLEVPGQDLAEAAELLTSGGWQPQLPSSPAELAESGEFWMLAAAQAMALGTIMVRYVMHHVDPIMATGWHMILGGAMLAVLAAAAGVPELMPAAVDTALLTEVAPAAAQAAGEAAAAAEGAQHSTAAALWASLQAQVAGLTPTDMLAMSYVSLLGGASSYGIFFWAATHHNLTALSSLTFLTPVFASIAGYFALGEVLSPMQLVGGAVTLSAVAAINYKPKPSGVEGKPVPTAQSEQR